MFYLDLLLIILLIFSFLNYIIKDTYSIIDSFYLKEYFDFVNLMNTCDLSDDKNCYKKYNEIYKYVVLVNNSLVFDNSQLFNTNKTTMFKIKRVYYNKDVEIFAC